MSKLAQRRLARDPVVLSLRGRGLTFKRIGELMGLSDRRARVVFRDALRRAHAFQQHAGEPHPECSLCGQVDERRHTPPVPGETNVEHARGCPRCLADGKHRVKLRL